MGTIFLMSATFKPFYFFFGNFFRQLVYFFCNSLVLHMQYWNVFLLLILVLTMPIHVKFAHLILYLNFQYEINRTLSIALWLAAEWWICIRDSLLTLRTQRIILVSLLITPESFCARFENTIGNPFFWQFLILTKTVII